MVTAKPIGANKHMTTLSSSGLNIANGSKRYMVKPIRVALTVRDQALHRRRKPYGVHREERSGLSSAASLQFGRGLGWQAVQASNGLGAKPSFLRSPLLRGTISPR